jgi:DNA gyrase inhibitor GyrI
MKAYTETIAAQPIVYMRRIGAYGADNFILMHEMKEWITGHNLWTENSVVYGIAQDDSRFVPPEKCRYDVCLVTETDIQDDNIHRGTLPPGKYIIFEVVHTSEEVQRFWGNIADKMMLQKREIDFSRSVLERYKSELIERGLCEFCIPVFA